MYSERGRYVINIYTRTATQLHYPARLRARVKICASGETESNET